jgi:hypothetical protein
MRTGRLVAVYWDDVTDHSTEAELAREKHPLARARTVGMAREVDGVLFVVGTTYEDADNKDDGPVTTIPSRWVRRITALQFGKRLRREDIPQAKS